MLKSPTARLSPVSGMRVALVAFLVCVAVTVAFARDAQPRHFDLPAGDARKTLRLFSRQSGEQIVFPVDRVRGIKTNLVRGEFLAGEALQRLIAGTGLAATQDESSGAFAVWREEKADTPQTVAPAPPRSKRGAPRDLGRTVILSPFEVHADPDNSYGALESNALTAFRADLATVPATVQIFTQTFMNDVAATSIEEVLIGYSGSVTALSNEPGSQLDMPGDRNGNQGMSIRGATVGDIKRDGFIGPPNNVRTASGITDNFSIERVEVVEGPQSILYGSVGGGGVVNAVSKRAEFEHDAGSFKLSLDQRGSRRALFDFNQGGPRFAFRLVGVSDKSRSVRDRLGDDLTGLYAQAAWRLGVGTTLRVSAEQTDATALASFKPNLDDFFAPADPRRGKDARYLALTGQLSDLDIIDGGVTYRNLESLAGWWSGERIKTRWSSATLESRLPGNFFAQLTAVYNDTRDLRVVTGRRLVPARGRVGAGNNPFDEAAVRIGGTTAPVEVNEQRDRNRGARLAIVHDDDVEIGTAIGHSKSVVGAQAFHRSPSFGSSGVALGYYEADAGWNAVVDPALTVDYGRVPLREIFFPVRNGVPDEPVFKPGTPRVTIDGRNYVLLPRIVSDPSRATAGNPYGLVPNNPTPANPNGFLDVWNRGAETHSGSVFLANFTDWAGGRLTTLAGSSLTRFESFNAGTGGVSRTPRANHLGWQVGASYAVRPWLRAFAVAGTAEQAEASTTDIYGAPLKNPKANSAAPDIGLKINFPDGRFAMQLSYSPATLTRNENKNTGDTSFRDAINPDGINGRLGGGDANQRVNLDRTLSAGSLVVTAVPARDWRMRLLVSHVDGRIAKSVVYRQLYNDEFHTNAGVVTHRDGSPVMVDPGGGAGAATEPLTVAMLNAADNPYYAQPDPTSGRITNPLLRAVLQADDPVHGPAATGRVGLPISAMQYDFTSPYPEGRVTIFREGEKNTGFNEFTFNLQNQFTFSSGPLEGAGVFLDVQASARNRAFYVNYPGANGSLLGTSVERRLYRLPDRVLVNLGVSYRRALGEKFEWVSQLNIRNLFNHSKVWIVPNPGNGTQLEARLSAQPRQFVWTNTISF